MSFYITANKKITFPVCLAISTRCFCSSSHWDKKEAFKRLQIVRDGLKDKDNLTETLYVETYILSDLHHVDSPFYINALTFSQQWHLSPNKLRSLPRNLKELDFPHLGKIRLLIQDYPTKSFKVNFC
jgi:hypothetical protein